MKFLASGVEAAKPAAGPCIGLVLSGGGARGLAHVGVLKVLEELRVPMHCVTGQVSSRLAGQPSTGAIWSGSVFLAADTSAGPAYFGLGAGEAGRWSLYLLLGAP